MGCSTSQGTRVGSDSEVIQTKFTDLPANCAIKLFQRETDDALLETFGKKPITVVRPRKGGGSSFVRGCRIRVQMMGGA